MQRFKGPNVKGLPLCCESKALSSVPLLGSHKLHVVLVRAFNHKHSLEKISMHPALAFAGKTTFIKTLLGREYPGCNIGPEPTTDKFTVVMHGYEDRQIPGAALLWVTDFGSCKCTPSA